MNKTRLVLVGGFLGTGKTTLLLRAARHLSEQNYRVAVVTNDQGQQLVDTGFLADQAIPLQEVAGGCFCCRFPDLLSSLRRLRDEVQPNVILAEPVGSCTDLIATVLRPIMRYHPDEFDVAPLTVLHDPQRAIDAFESTVGYLYDRQLMEAEVIALSKSDLRNESAESAARRRLQRTYPGAKLMSLSARTGEGIAEWVEHVLRQPARRTTALDIDYATYADAEASLGWLNTRLDLVASPSLSPALWITDLLTSLSEIFAANRMAVAHLKVYLKTPQAAYKASLTQNGLPSFVDGDVRDLATDRAAVTLNARVSAAPEYLRAIVQETLTETCARFDARFSTTHIECFSPLPPEPTFRLM